MQQSTKDLIVVFLSFLVTFLMFYFIYETFGMAGFWVGLVLFSFFLLLIMGLREIFE
jgi:hypothetical protein